MKPSPASLALALLVASTAPLLAQDQQPQSPSAARREQQAAPGAEAAPTAPADPTASADAAPDAATPEQLEQLVAPIALYPDALLAQLLMASTYPLEIVEASRWVEKNPKVTGDKLEAALKDQTWDPSVKSLCGFPDVLKRMNDNLDWTQALGDAFLGQKSELMDAVQNMRRKAYDAGNLKTSKEQTVTEREDKIIIIEPAQPEVIYVPTYYPTAVYGGWGYPTYYYPPLYPPPPAGAAFFGFAAGMFWGAAIWGGCSWGWGHTDVDIDINRQNNFINKTEIDARRQQVKDRSGAASTRDGARADKGTWQHDPSHRKGVGYKDSATAQKFGASQGQSRVTRDQARGYGDRAAPRPATGASTRPGGASSARPAPAPSTRPSTTTNRQAGPRPSSAATPHTTGQRTGSFTGSQSASHARASSARGSSSRGSAGSRSSAGRSGGGRGGGGRGGRR